MDWVTIRSLTACVVVNFSDLRTFHLTRLTFSTKDATDHLKVISTTPAEHYDLGLSDFLLASFAVGSQAAAAVSGSQPNPSTIAADAI